MTTKFHFHIQNSMKEQAHFPPLCQVPSSSSPTGRGWEARGRARAHFLNRGWYSAKKKAPLKPKKTYTSWKSVLTFSVFLASLINFVMSFSSSRTCFAFSSVSDVAALFRS